MNRRFFAAAALLALVGCEQEAQTLPFDVEASVTRTVGGQGGTVSTPAGASMQFPSGSVNGNVQVSLATTDVPAEVQNVGAPASPAFKVEPVGTVLSKPADLGLKFSSGDANRTWLATIVSSVNGDVRRYGGSRVDLSTGVVSADVDQLGVFTAVIPPSSAVFPVQGRASAALEPLATTEMALSVESVVVDCGDAADPCTGLSVTATNNLLDLVEEAAVVYPTIAGTLSVNGGAVTGELVANASLRIKLESGQTAESVEVNAVLRPTSGTTVSETSGEIRFTNVLHRISGSTTSDSETFEEIATLVVPKSGSGGLVTIERSFEITAEDGDLETARVTLTFPVIINQ